MRYAPLLLTAAALVAAGCIEAPQDGADFEREARTGGSMTASETTASNSALCEGVGLGFDDRFCAVKTVIVEGTLSGFDLLDVDLETFNGDLTIKAGSEGRWGLTVELKARGSTAAEAERRVDDIEFRWAHEDASGHFVEAAAEYDGNADSRSAQMTLTMPPSLAMRLSAATSNGDATLDGGRAEALALTTSNGDVVARGHVSHAALTTSNGEIDATLTPMSTGRWALTTSNGEVDLKVPEGPAYGYSIQGTTSNGEVEYSLRDGEAGPCPEGSQYYTPPCNHRAFETSRFSSRDKQVWAVLTTSNGEVSVAPS